MKHSNVEIATRGRKVSVPSIESGGNVFVVTGRVIKMATIRDEEFVEGALISDPAGVINALRKSGLGVDILAFSEKLGEGREKLPYYSELDNAAVASTSSYTDWWEALPQESRKNVRRATKRGVTVRSAVFDDELIRGIKEIYDETPVRQGRRFWHYGKDLETIKRENGTYLERSEFICAYHEGEIIGFMKIVYVDRIANMMQILSKRSHYDKRPMNALIAKAVEICHERGVSGLVYSKFVFGNKDKSQIAEFKQRNGFVQNNFSRYFIPLTLKGRFALRLGLHRGLLGILPSGLINFLLWMRAEALRLKGHLFSGR